MSEYTIKELPTDYKRSDADQAYMDMLVISRPKVEKRKVSTEQSASTKRILEAHARGESMVQFKNPIDIEKAQVKDENGNVFINERNLSAQEMVNYQGMRQNAKNQLGESKLSSASDERKEAARQAYVCTPPSDLTSVELEKLTRHERITEPKQISTKKKGLFERVMSWIFKKEYAEMNERMSYAERQELWKEDK